jgi:hypothetical protein
VFGENEGFLCIARKNRKTDEWEEEFFRYPDSFDSALDYIAQHTQLSDVYYCPHLFSTTRRVKETVSVTPCAWSDLDSCTPDKLLVTPTITIESSPGRFQALWVFESEVDPMDAEDLSKRIAYKHLDEGADKSGWDLTQLLRIPFTYNHKYQQLAAEPPVVKVTETFPKRYNIEDFEMYPPTEGSESSLIPFPEDDTLSNLDADAILEQHKTRIHPNAWHLFQTEPVSDWSKNLWQLQMILFEGGLTREEVFVVAQSSACNKYKRDGRSDKYLWKEVCRSWSKYEEQQVGITPTTHRVAPLLSDQERTWAATYRTIIEEYTDWAKLQGDAAWAYHQAGAFITLSSLLAGNVRLPTSFGVVVPNLWFMILADTTLTRKTTAMDMAMDLIMEVDPDAILATDGSIEGLFTSLSMRPGRPSIFLRDEFSGLLESITKKDYYAGMAETLTKLYDGKFQKRVLRKEIIEVRDPVLILFAGGIRTRILQLLNYEHVASGFLPRFVFVSAESDVSRLRPLGPPTQASLGQRGFLVSRFSAIHGHYAQAQHITVNGTSIAAPKRFDAELTPDAWARYNRFENDMLQASLKSMQADVMTPSFDRLAKSGLKCAVLLAAAETLGEKVVVEEHHVVKAFFFVEQWREFTLDVLSNIGKTAQEKQIETIFGAIGRTPGVLRSQVMQNYHLTARETDTILGTLEQRGQITRMRSG